MATIAQYIAAINHQRDLLAGHTQWIIDRKNDCV